MCCNFRAHAFARSVAVMKCSGEQDSSSSRQQVRWAIVCSSPQLHVNVAPPPHRCLCTANPSVRRDSHPTMIAVGASVN